MKIQTPKIGELASLIKSIKSHIGVKPISQSFKTYWTNSEILELIESHIVKDNSGADRECAYNEGLKQLWREFYNHKKESPFPFCEGDTYFTIEDGEVVESCWDSESEEMHSKEQVYFSTRKEAECALS